jgi:hypothetical protein
LVAKNTVRIFKLIWMSLQDVYSTGCIFYAWQGKAMRAGFERKPPPGNHSHKKKLIILKWFLRNISGACILDMSDCEYGPMEGC